MTLVIKFDNLKLTFVVKGGNTDSTIKELMNIASIRRSKYVKGEATLKELPEKMAEIGVLLLDKARKLPELKREKIKEELIEVQNKVDDLRKSLFLNKILAK